VAFTECGSDSLARAYLNPLTVISLVNQKQFTAESNESVLDAALRANLVLEHSCKTGRCGTCKSQVLSGNTAPILDEVALTAAEKSDGWILTCARAATSDVQLSVEDVGTENLPVPRTFPCRIKSLEKLAPDVLRVMLRLPPQQTFDYRAGQYIDIIGASGTRRSYSIANAPTVDKTIELHIRRVPGGAMSHYWFGEAKVNDLLRLHGPLGTFFLRDVTDGELIFLATGTGMAPIKSLLESLRVQPAALKPSSVSVFWGGRTPEDLYWNTVESGQPHRFTPVLSRAGSSWTGARGYVQQAVAATGIDLTRASVYACGSPAMIESAKTELQEAGLATRRFHSDAFVCSDRLGPKTGP
jgi:CDP-4-dehydro-6-deoxyglucose reductase